MGSPGAGSSGHECSFKILLNGDSGVGKSSLLVSFVAAAHLDDDIAATIGVDFKIKFLTVGGKKLKLIVRDTDSGGSKSLGGRFLFSCEKEYSETAAGKSCKAQWWVLSIDPCRMMKLDLWSSHATSK